MTFPIQECIKIKPNGIKCGSPALRGGRLCYYHQADRKRIAKTIQAARVRKRAYIAPPTPHMLQQIEFKSLNSYEDIQIALNAIMQSLWSGLIDNHTASTLLNVIRMKQSISESTQTAAANTPAPTVELDSLLNTPLAEH